MKYYYDLHIHSCLSPCGDDDMTPYNLVNMAKIFGYDIIALTDHNSCRNCPSAVEIGKNIGITVVPGMEICTSEEIHAICLFPDVDSAMNFSDYVSQHIPPIKNKEKIFGNQLVMDCEDEILERYEILLTTATDISIDSLPELVEKYNGVCYPAHIDRSSYSIISSLGDFNEELKVNCFEMTLDGDAEQYRENYPATKNKLLIRSSDSHYLQNMVEPSQTIELTKNTAEALIEKLKGQ